jgi:hypothetical protein
MRYKVQEAPMISQKILYSTLIEKEPRISGLLEAIEI